MGLGRHQRRPAAPAWAGEPEERQVLVHPRHLDLHRQCGRKDPDACRLLGFRRAAQDLEMTVQITAGPIQPHDDLLGHQTPARMSRPAIADTAEAIFTERYWYMGAS